MRLAAALAMLASTFTHAPAASAGSGCGTYHARDYVICVESGPEWMPNGRPAGNQHPGRSSASGPCGMLAATRHKYHGDSLAACGRYMAVRYGTWASAERFHRRYGWW